jgi:DNA-binding winged helix-turn-helix (wHTH) protein
VQNPNRLLGKQVLMQALWPDTFVEEANLTLTMSALRKALAKGQPDVQYIETIPHGAIDSWPRSDK